MSINIQKYGGFGTGALGNRTVSSTTARLNSAAKVTAIENNGYTLKIANQLLSTLYGTFTVGQEVMFHVTNTTDAMKDNFGLYTIANITRVEDDTITLDKAVAVTDLTGLSCQVITIPQFANLTVTAALQAEAWDNTNGRGGILAIKATGTVDLTGGSLIAYGKGLPAGARPIVSDMDNYYLEVKLPMSEGSGIIVVMANQILLSENSRLGATWSGAMGIGLGGAGGYGYDRPGSGDPDTPLTREIEEGRGSNGSDTGGPRLGKYGGGGNGGHGGNANYANGTGGAGGNGGNGGTGVKTANSGCEAGVGGAAGYAGSTVFIVAKNIPAFWLDVISTGGAGGSGGTGARTNGGPKAPSGSAGTNGGAGCSGGGGGGGGSSRVQAWSTGGGGGGAGGGAGYAMIATSANSVVPEAAYSSAYGLDADIIVRPQSLHISRQALAITGTCGGFSLSGNQPTGTERRVVFQIGGIWYNLSVENGVATPSALTVQTITVDSVLTEGNTVAELAEVESIPAFNGQNVYIAVAMTAPEGATAFPTLKIGMENTAVGEAYDKYVESPEYEISNEDVSLVKATADTTTAGDGVAEVEARLYTNNAWTNYMPLAQVAGRSASKIQFQAHASVSTIGGADSAAISRVQAETSKTISYVSGSKASIYSKVQEFDAGMMYVRLFVKHSKLVDATLKAYCMFIDTPLKREMYAIGTATGARQTIHLTDEDIDLTTFRLYANGDEIFDFDYNSIENNVSFTAALGATMYGSYKYQVGPEDWQEMTKGFSQPYASNPGYASTEYSYSATGIEKAMGAIRIDLDKPTGSSISEDLGFGTGRTQVVFLRHYALEDSIRLYQGAEPILDRNWNYDAERKMITLIALKDRPITADYNWIAETPKLSGYVAAWNQ